MNSIEEINGLIMAVLLFRITKKHILRITLIIFN